MPDFSDLWPPYHGFAFIYVLFCFVFNTEGCLWSGANTLRCVQWAGWVVGFELSLPKKGASLVAQMIKNLPAILETQVQSLGWEDPLEKGMATHSSILGWRIPWTEEPGRLQSMGSQRVGHDWATNTFAFTKKSSLSTEEGPPSHPSSLASLQYLPAC